MANININRKKTKNFSIAWGFFWLLLAGLVIANTFGGFVDVGIWSYIIGGIALLVLFSCIASLSLANVLIPIAALYYIFQAPISEATSLNLPAIPFWPLALGTFLATIGLHMMLPSRFGKGNIISVNIGGNSGGNRKYKHKKYDKRGNRIDIDDDDVVIIDVDSDSNEDGQRGEDYTERTERTKIEEGDDENNPHISVSFGYASRYLHATNLETAELSCSFGGMEVYFDNVTLSPEGAEINVNCSFGSMEIYVPSHWRVIDDISASLANAEVNRKLQSNDADAPTVRITGSVSLGNVEVNRIKGS